MRLVAIAVLGLLVLCCPLHPTSATAEVGACPPGQVSQAVPGHGFICVAATDPGQAGDTTPGETTHTTGKATCTSDGQPIPCVTDLGVWYSSHQCYAQPMDPQPSPGSPAWGGHTADQGHVWVCWTYGGPVTNGAWFFVAVGDAPPSVDPADLAKNAVGQLPLEVPVVNLAPGPPNLTYVGLDTWLWIEPQQWHDLDLTVTAGDTSVTVLAHPVKVRWDVTESQVVCDSPGRPWRLGLSSAAETPCSYTFQHTSNGRPGGVDDVAATLTYEVSWTCSGACLMPSGELGEVDGLSGRSSIQVGERQSVVTRRPAGPR